MAWTGLDTNSHDVLAVVPARAADMARLSVLRQSDARPAVAVVGKYNHGKSRLLNELLGSDRFAVADKRETVVLSEHAQDDVRWLDAPGLDADVHLADDGHAHHAAWLCADIRLFVHAAKEGELDANERALLLRLQADEARTQRQTLLVLTQIDQLADDAQVKKVANAIGNQVPGSVMHLVSSTRHRLGLEGEKKLLIEKSGIPALHVALRAALGRVAQARIHEMFLLFREIREELQHLRATRQEQLQALQSTWLKQRQAFDRGLEAAFDKVQMDLAPVLALSGPDQALVADSFEDMFKLTAAKQERARLQVAYSRACIEINAHLVRHGVVALPSVQQTSVRSLDTVMVAVMGVSVKYRKELRRLFCETAGREALQHDFARYFELSEERTELARVMADAQAGVAAADKALQALRALEGA